MKKRIVGAATLSLLLALPMTSQAATLTSGKEYVPSKAYKYSVYEISRKKAVGLTCKGPVQQRTCMVTNTKKNDGGYITSYKNKKYDMGIAYSDGLIIPTYTFPLKENVTVHAVEPDFIGTKKYTYKVLALDTKKTVGKKTYKHVIKIKNEDGGYTFIAKNHGVILFTYKVKGKQKTIYKISNYVKR